MPVNREFIIEDPLNKELPFNNPLKQEESPNLLPFVPEIFDQFWF
jgi:hypothetical protein